MVHRFRITRLASTSARGILSLLGGTEVLLHQSIAQLDMRNLALIETLHPGVVEMVDQYAEKEGGGLRRFSKKEISWKNI